MELWEEMWQRRGEIGTWILMNTYIVHCLELWSFRARSVSQRRVYDGMDTAADFEFLRLDCRQWAAIESGMEVGELEKLTPHYISTTFLSFTSRLAYST